MLTQLFSAPALNIQREFKNFDGTTFIGKPQGNQHLNWIQTEDGNILKYNAQSHNFEYAMIKNNILRASGVKYRESNSKDIRALRNIERVNIDEVYKLWAKKRANYYKSIQKLQK
jgi:hypothetical protein